MHLRGLLWEESKTRARPKTACAPRARAESEHGPRRPGDLENVALEDLTLSPQSFRMRGSSNLPYFAIYAVALHGAAIYNTRYVIYTMLYIAYIYAI